MFFSPMVDPKWPPKWPSGGQPWDQLISLSAVKKQKFSFPPSCSGGRTFVYFEIPQVCTFTPQMKGTWLIVMKGTLNMGQSFQDGLETSLADSGSNPSAAGESQLVCLARTVPRRSKIIGNSKRRPQARSNDQNTLNIVYCA